jgi:hypothetical protein
MTKRKPPRRVSPPVDVSEENKDEQDSTTRTENAMSKKSDLNWYSNASYFLEEKVGLGRNGKRLSVGAGVGAGTWAAGHYGGVELINENMPFAIGAGVTAGVVGTALMDHLMIDAEQEALMELRRFQDKPKEVQDKLREQVGELLLKHG